ncbi:unnamed protein product, partial [Porites evermanni]
KAWARSTLGVPFVLTIPLQVALYLMELVDRAVHEGHSVSVIESVCYSIRWGGTSAGPPLVHGQGRWDILFLFILLVGFPVNLRVKDITIFEDFMKINLIKRKNDQHRDGHVSVFERSCKPTCPVGITERLFS